MEDLSLYHILNKYIQNYDEKKYNELLAENTSLQKILRTHKNKIDSCHKNWDIAKKYANTYEFIFSFNNDGVSDVNPISRSYFKLIEILKDNNVLMNDNDIKCACLCEGPGGFIQAINDVYKQRVCPIDCITLISNDKKVPNWKLNNISNYRVSYGADNTGNMYNVKNIEHFIDSVGKNTCHLITADGGFDFSKDFNSQEKNFLLLLLCEIYCALNIQVDGGVFVVKVFDLFDTHTLDMLSLLRMFYDEITIHKPKTSRPANSEKYLICKSFNSRNENVLNYVKDKIQNKSVNIDQIIGKDLRMNTLLHIYEYNKTFVDKQIFHIEKTLELIKQCNFDKTLNKDLCIQWCKTYGVPIKKDLV